VFNPNDCVKQSFETAKIVAITISATVQ